jgi:DNA (cytosine-5)-methyltransferase 1
MRAVELFAGAGGLGMGVSRAGFEPVAVIEWNRHCCDTLRQNQARGLEPLAHWPLVEGDVRDFDFAAIRGGIDLVSGGPPCQPFSLGGKHRGHLDARDMFPEAIRAVRELRPRAFIFENVKGLARASFMPYLEYLRLRLAHPELILRPGEDWPAHRARLERHHSSGRRDGLYYRILSRGLLNAANYGVPQRRERLFLVGFRADLGVEWSFPEATHDQDALLWSQWRSGEYWERHRVPKRQRPEGGKGRARALALDEEPAARPWVTVRDALADLPDPEAQPRAAAAYPNHRFQPGARSYYGHTGSPLDEPAKTLKAGDHGVPGGENMLLRPDGSVRYFTLRESARLQTFPDQYRFHGSWTESMRQLGNAVPVDLAAVVAKSVKARLDRATAVPPQA